MDNSPSVAVPSTVFDPAAPVPEEFDVFCQGCGYSLVGLSGDRCPECGRPFDPNEMPYARVPWLHRRRIGRWAAYWKTVRQVVGRPREFAAELCRPVRISADDARRFRKVSSMVAATAVIGAIAAIVFLFDPPTRRPADLVRFLLALVIGWIAAVIYFRLATDMPVFIWKGLPSLPAVHVSRMFLVTFLGFLVCMVPLVPLVEFLERRF